MAIERKFIDQNLREFRIKEFVTKELSRVGLSDVRLKRTPLGDKIVVKASRPGLVVGRGGANIQSLTRKLKEEFELENPQIEIEEIEKPDLDADIVCERIVNSLERFGSQRTKGIGHRAMSDVMNAGALGVEILITGKIPSMRARRWRFYMGYLKKAGDIAVEDVRHSIMSVTLKSGAVGVQVRIMPPHIILPDTVTLKDYVSTEIEVLEDDTPTEEIPEETAPVAKEQAPKAAEESKGKTAEAKAPAAEEAQPKVEATKAKENVPEEKSSGTEETQ